MLASIIYSFVPVLGELRLLLLWSHWLLSSALFRMCLGVEVIFPEQSLGALTRDWGRGFASDPPGSRVQETIETRYMRLQNISQC